MIPLKRVERAIPDLIFLVVIITTISSFVLSFVNLQAAAIESGINAWLSFLWPVCIDAVLIAGSLMILRSSLRNESPVVGWLVLLGFTLVSTWFNILHSPEEITSRLAHAVPPVSLCVSIEILMLIIRSDLQRPPTTPLQESILCNPPPVQDTEPEPFLVVQEEVLHKSKGLEDVDDPIIPPVIADPVVVSIAEYLKNNPETRITHISRDLDIPRTTLKRKLDTLVALGMISHDPDRGYWTP